MTLRFYDGGSFKILAAKPLVHWLFLLACLVFRALLLLPFAVDMDSYLVLAATNLTSSSMTMTTWAPATATAPPQCSPKDRGLCSVHITRDKVHDMCNRTTRTCRSEHPEWESYCLGFCKWRTYGGLLESPDQDCFVNTSNQECSQCLDELLTLEDKIRDMYEEYVGIILRYDCNVTYSMWDCEHCKESYKDWLCATQLAFYREGKQVKPCRDHCLRVHRQCPFFLPHKPYCGQRSFLCPEIRDFVRHPGNATYSTPSCLACDRSSDEDGRSGVCREVVTAAPPSSPSRGPHSIHSIPHVTVIVLVCVLAMIQARTLCGLSLT